MKKALTSILTAALIISSAGALAYSPDITEINNELKILEGDENGNLNLDGYVKRGEMAKIVCALMKDAAAAEVYYEFSDTKSHWSDEYVQRAANLGLVNGFEDGTFRPDDKVTYEQAIKMIIGNNFAASYPLDYISYAIDNGLLENVDALYGEYMTRGDVAQICANLIKALKENGISENDSFGFSGLSSLYQSDEYAPDKKTSGGNRYADASAPTMGAGSAGGNVINGSSASIGSSSGGSGGASSANAPAISLDSAPVPAPDEAAPEASISEAYDSAYADSNIYQPSINPYMNSEGYSVNDENIFKNTLLSPLSTISTDTDTASYSNLRRFAVYGQKAEKGSIRTEELINYFDYDLPQPTDGTPFSVTTEAAKCPWNNENILAMVNIQGKELTERQPQNLVFLLDVSGSMYSYNKLPLVKRSMELLLSRLDERDTISVVTYASGVNVAASGIKASEKDKLMNIINSLHASGGTYGAGGLQLAYEQAEEFKCDGNNRIILCTDGDFNIGMSDNNELKKMISEKRDSNIFISVLGFGMGNYKDDKLEIIADNGNGGYYYIDNLREAKKVLSDEMTSTLYTIAKDVKIQVELNPAHVQSYRLIGYENRTLQTEQFADDKVDAGELGAGASVTAFYEIVPAAGGAASSGTDSGLRYHTPQYRNNGELMDVKLRYKLPEGTESILKEYPVANKLTENTSDNFRFAAGIAELGMLLNDSEYKGNATYDSVIELTRGALGEDPLGFRHEFVQLADLIRFINR